MTDSRGTPAFDRVKSAAIKRTLTNVVSPGTLENNHYRRQRLLHIALPAAAVSVALTAGAVVTFYEAPVSNAGDVACLARAEFDDGRFPGTMATLGIPATEERPDSRIDIEDPLGLCSDLWAQNTLNPEEEDGVTDPELYDASGSHPVPHPLTVCVMEDGRAAVVPGPYDICGNLGLANLPAR